MADNFEFCEIIHNATAHVQGTVAGLETLIGNKNPDDLVWIRAEDLRVFADTLLSQSKLVVQLSEIITRMEDIETLRKSLG